MAQEKLTPWGHGPLESACTRHRFCRDSPGEEVWNLENIAWLSSCLLLGITAGIVVGSLLFEKRFWCRYRCPVEA